MNVVVCGKVIPASTVTIEIDPNTKRMVRKGVPHELDPAAASAVEEGLRLIEKHGGTVTLVTMGTSDATIGIRNALAMGAASAVHILDDAVAGSDTLGTAKLLAAAIKKQEFDLVICATESSDSYSGIVPGQIAYFLGVPPVTFAKEITVDGNQDYDQTTERNRLRRRRVDVARVGSLQQWHQRTALSAAQRHHGGEEKRDQSL